MDIHTRTILNTVECPDTRVNCEQCDHLVECAETFKIISAADKGRIEEVDEIYKDMLRRYR